MMNLFEYTQIISGEIFQAKEVSKKFQDNQKPRFSNKNNCRFSNFHKPSECQQLGFSLLSVVPMQISAFGTETSAEYLDFVEVIVKFECKNMPPSP